MSLEKTPRFTADAVGTALRTAAPFDVGGYVLDFSTPKRNGSHYVNFGIFGADGRIVQ
jgi:hypothetical protein